MLYSQRHLPQIRTQFGLGPSIMRCRSRGAGGRCTVQWTAAALLLLLLLARHRSQSRWTTGGARQLRNKRSNQIITSDSLTDQEKHNDRMGGLYHCLLFCFLNQTCLTTIKVKFEIYKNRYCDMFSFFFRAMPSRLTGQDHHTLFLSLHPSLKDPHWTNPHFAFLTPEWDLAVKG